MCTGRRMGNLFVCYRLVIASSAHPKLSCHSINAGTNCDCNVTDSPLVGSSRHQVIVDTSQCSKSDCHCTWHGPCHGAWGSPTPTEPAPTEPVPVPPEAPDQHCCEARCRGSDQSDCNAHHCACTREEHEENEKE